LKCLKALAETGTQSVVFLGAGSVGKGTLAKLLSLVLQERRPKILTVSEVIRHHSSQDTPLGERIRANIARLRKQEGVVTSNLDDAPICEAIDQEILSALESGHRLMLLDGFLRTEGQMKRFMSCPNLLVVLLVAGLEESLERASRRREEAAQRSQTVREDDKPEAVRRRFRVFERDTLPGFRTLKKVRPAATMEIDATRTPREKAIRVLRNLYPSGRVPSELVSCFDNPSSPVARFVTEIEGGSRPLRNHLHMIGFANYLPTNWGHAAPAGA